MPGNTLILIRVRLRSKFVSSDPRVTHGSAVRGGANHADTSVICDFRRRCVPSRALLHPQTLAIRRPGEVSSVVQHRLERLKNLSVDRGIILV